MKKTEFIRRLMDNGVGYWKALSITGAADKCVYGSFDKAYEKLEKLDKSPCSWGVRVWIMRRVIKKCVVTEFLNEKLGLTPDMREDRFELCKYVNRNWRVLERCARDFGISFKLSPDKAVRVALKECKIPITCIEDVDAVIKGGTK